MLLSVLAAAAIGVAPIGPSGPDSASAAALLRPAAPSVRTLQTLPAAPPLRLDPSPADPSGSPDDPPDPAPQLIEYSDAYFTRLMIHKWASYLTLPLFGAEYYVGNKLMGNNPPSWARPTHKALAGGIAGLFVVNTITGGWNLIEGWKDPAGRTSRLIHASLMLLSDAGFVATGMSVPSRDDGLAYFPGNNQRQVHRNWATASMVTALVGYVMMLPPFHQD